MSGSEFRATWYPRIGEDAAKELRRARRIALLGPLAAVFAVGAGALIGSGPVGDVIGAVLAIACLAYVLMFILAQRRTAAAVSAWFDVEPMKWLPRMAPQRFDEWRRLRGFISPDERRSAKQPE